MAIRFAPMLAAFTFSCLMAQVTPKAQLIAEPLAKQYKSGSPIEVRMHLKNLSWEQLNFAKFGPMYDYSIGVSNGSTEPPKTDMGLGLWKSYVPLSSELLTLSGGAELVETIDIAMIYKLVPGTYRATVARKIRPTPKTEEPVSAEVFTFDVVP